MYHVRGVFLFVALCAVTIAAYSQQSYPNTLLWRVSGKGLTHPSYLFGTMHLTDQRLFMFGDSVYHAIEKTAGLAIEINPDELGAYYMNKMLDDAEGKKLSEILTEKDYKKYRLALARKFKKPASEITTSDIVKEKNKWLADYLENGEMPTFVDAYLYNLARRQGKWLGGIEDITDQDGLMDELVDKSDIDYLLANDSSFIRTNSNRMMEHMIDLYTSQNITGIEAISGEQSVEHNDILLIRRNIKMARRIDSLIALRTMFVAVGAAHLPGDSGVIHLLQQRGFTVEPVFSSHRINAKDYTFKEVHLPWTETEDVNGMYKVAMPGNPASVKLYGIIEMKYLFDIFNLSNYCTMAVINPDNQADNETVLNSMAQRMFKTKYPPASKKIVSNGIEGREYTQVLQGQNLRLQAFVHDKVVYVAFVCAVKKEVLSSADANHFFSSFSVSTNRPVATGSYTFTDSIMGISFTSPASLAYNKKMSNDKDDGWLISCFTGLNMTTGSYVMLFSKDVKPAHYINSDTLIQSQITEYFKTQYTNLRIHDENLQGCYGKRFSGRNIQQPGLFLDAFSVIKNNRNIVLLIICDSSQLNAPATQQMFSSLHFIDPPAMAWKPYTTGNQLLTAVAPGPFRPLDNGRTNFVYTFDTTTATSYYIFPDTLNKYSWYPHDSSFWKERIPYYVVDDTLEKEEDTENAGLPGKELLTHKGNLYKRMRLVLHGDKLYEVMVSGNKNFVYNSHATTFLTSFTVNTPVTNRHFITQSKAAQLINDLQSKDSATRGEAHRSFYSASFDRNDVPLLHQALIKQYQSPFGEEASDIINTQIAARLSRMGDSSTVRFINDHYASLINEKEPLKNAALQVLANTHTRESYNTLAHLLNDYALPVECLNYQCLNGFKHSLPLTTSIFPALQKLAKDSAHAGFMAQLVTTLKDSGYISQAQLATSQNDYIEAAAKWLPATRKPDFYSNGVNDLVKLVGGFNTTAANNVLKSYLAAKDNYLKKDAVIQLVKNKQQVPVSVLNTLAATRGIRPVLYQELKDINKAALFPRQYLTQQHFGESALFETASDDDEEPQKITFLSTKTAVFKGRSYVFYLYRVVLDNEGRPPGYLGIAGGYKPGSKAIEPVKELTGVYWDESFNSRKIDAHFKKYLKSMSE
jgi:uncharacterized protein YbaP (TraB family)